MRFDLPFDIQASSIRSIRNGRGRIRSSRTPWGGGGRGGMAHPENLGEGGKIYCLESVLRQLWPQQSLNTADRANVKSALTYFSLCSSGGECRLQVKLGWCEYRSDTVNSNTVDSKFTVNSTNDFLNCVIFVINIGTVYGLEFNLIFQDPLTATWSANIHCHS